MDDCNAALESYEQAIKTEEHFGYSDKKVSYLMMKGLAFFEMNRNIEAGKAYQSALDARKLLGIADHADTAAIYDAIGVNHLALEEFREALEAFRQCLKLRKTHLGDHTLTAHSFIATGFVHLLMGEYEAARENFQHAAILAKSLFSHREVTASQFELLAPTDLKMGNYSRNMRLKLLGEHPDIAMSFQLPGKTRFEMGNFDEHLDVTHGNKIVRGIIDSIGGCLKTPKNLDGATTGHNDDFKAILEELKSVLKSMEQINDAEHADIATNCDQFGCCYFLMDEYNAALESFDQATKITEEHAGDSDDKVSCLFNKGAVHSKMNQNIEAGKAYQSTLDLGKFLETENHTDNATIHHLLGETYFVLGK